MIVGIIQARMGSTRLPGKILRPIRNMPMLQILHQRVSASNFLDKIYVATTIEKQDDAVYEFCMLNGILCFRGSENDTLSRYVAIAENERASTIVRLTGDNPFVNGELVDLVISDFQNRSLDYINTLDCSNYPKGLTVEVMRAECLLAASHSNLPLDREHVTKFIRDRADSFNLGYYRDDLVFPEIELTVDTLNEFQKAAYLFGLLRGCGVNFSLTELAKICHERKREIASFGNL